jgi:hypothetical protein
MRDFKASDLAAEVGLSRSQIARRASEIPGHRRTKGGHWRFRDCQKLRDWILKNQKSTQWKSVTGPLEKAIAHYSIYYLKRLTRPAAVNLWIAFDATIQKLKERRAWMEKNLHF